MIRFRPLWGFRLFAAVVMAVLLGLGVWQLNRLAEKTQLLAVLNQRISQAPQPLTAALAAHGAGVDVQFQRVTLRGVVLDRPAIHLRMVRDGVPGVQVLLPFLDDSAHVIWVDAGFTATPPDTISRGPRTLVVRLRTPDVQRMKPDNDPAGNSWYWRDLAALNADMGPAAVPVLAEAETALLRGVRPTPLEPQKISNRHLEYALTWFAFAGVWLLVYLGLHVRVGRLSYS